MPVRFCPGCGKPQQPSNVFCPNCGRNLRHHDDAPPERETPPRATVPAREERPPAAAEPVVVPEPPLVPMGESRSRFVTRLERPAVAAEAPPAAKSSGKLPEELLAPELFSQLREQEAEASRRTQRNALLGCAGFIVVFFSVVYAIAVYTRPEQPPPNYPRSKKVRAKIEEIERRKADEPARRRAVEEEDEEDAAEGE